MQGVDILIAVVLLLFGRRLFWLFVGGVGFIVGFNYASQAFQGQPGWVALVIAAAVGLVAAILSIFLQRLVVAIAGFFAGGYFLASVAAVAWPQNQPDVQWIVFVVGGIVGAILTAALLDPALILLSSLAGATALAQNAPFSPAGKGAVFLGLLIFGIVVQAAQYSRAKKTVPPASSPQTPPP
jgi:hypothetical protein